MDNIKVCPHCGAQQFMAYIKRGGLVESVGIDDKGNPQFKVIKEGAKGKYELEIIRCTKCGKNVIEAELIGGVPCKTCGKLMNPDALDENGNCEVCAMLVTNPQLKNASQDDLLRMLARAMKGMKADTSLVEQKEAQASAIEADLGVTPQAEPVQQDVQEGEAPEMSAADAILSGSTIPEAAPAAKGRGRKRAVRKASDGDGDAVTPTEEAAVVQESGEPPVEEQVQAQVDLANSQTAPFPDVEGMPGVVPAPQPAPPAELPTPVGTGFQMFDNNDDDEPF